MKELIAWVKHFAYLVKLPSWLKTINWRQCKRSKSQVILDFLYIWLVLKIIPEHYGPCRLWEVSPQDWVYYYGSPYTPLQKARRIKRVQRLAYQLLYHDKAVCEQLCKALEVRQPRSFGMIEPDGPYREQLEQFSCSVPGERLILKPIFGHGGNGICILEQDDYGIIVHTPSSDLPLSDFQLECSVVVQQFIKQDPRIAAIWPSSVNTIRVVTLLQPSGDVLNVTASMRFGVGKAYVDNWSAGGVSIGVDLKTGKLRKVAYDKRGNQYLRHPSSQVLFEGFQIPEWQRVLELAHRVQRGLPFCRMLGLDICLDEQGDPILIEINPTPDLLPMEQANGPLLTDKQILSAFAEYNLIVSRVQRRLIERQS
jgi:hypothetical protein